VNGFIEGKWMNVCRTLKRLEEILGYLAEILPKLLTVEGREAAEKRRRDCRV